MVRGRGVEGTGARAATKDEHAPMGLELEVVRLAGALEGLEARGARQRACNRCDRGCNRMCNRESTRCALSCAQRSLHCTLYYPYFINTHFCQKLSLTYG